MSSDCEEERDWRGLPVELLHLIYKKLPDIRDFIRFRTVSKSWCSSVITLSNSPEQQLPWVLDASYNVFNDPGCALKTKHAFYSLSYGKVGWLDIEPHCRRAFHGASREYLLLSHDYKKCHKEEYFALFNPLTKSYIKLAQMPKSYNLWRNFICYFYFWIDDSDIDDPISKRSIGMMFDSYSVSGKPMVYNLQTMEWAAHNIAGGRHFAITTCCYMKGMFFATSIGARTYIFCEKSLLLIEEIPVITDEYYDPSTTLATDLFDICNTVVAYLIACGDVMLRVRWVEDRYHRGRTMETLRFLIYRLDYQVDVAGVGRHHWVETNNINIGGEQMLFLDRCNGFSVRARPTEGFIGNCIYFLYPWPSGSPYRYDITTATIHRIPCPFGRCAWFIPGLR